MKSSELMASSKNGRRKKSKQAASAQGGGVDVGLNTTMEYPPIDGSDVSQELLANHLQSIVRKELRTMMEVSSITVAQMRQYG